MHPKRTLLDVLGICLTVCAAVMLWIDAIPCILPPWCDLLHAGRLLLLSTLALPLVRAIGRGGYAGIVQLQRTGRMLRRLRALPQRALTPEQQALARSLGLQDRIDVVTTRTAHAWCAGLLRPRIAVTTGLLDVLTVDELAAVLRHELAHLRRYDPLRTLLWTICAAMGLGVEAQQQAELQRELAADRAVIAAGQRQALARALLKLLPHQPHETPLLAISGISVTEARIDQLLQQEPLLRQVRAPLHRRWYVVPTAWSLMLLLCLAIIM